MYGAEEIEGCGDDDVPADDASDADKDDFIAKCVFDASKDDCEEGKKCAL